MNEHTKEHEILYHILKLTTSGESPTPRLPGAEQNTTLAKKKQPTNTDNVINTSPKGKKKRSS